MKLSLILACNALVILGYLTIALFQSFTGQTITGTEAKSIEAIQFLIQNQIIGFAGGSVSVIIAIATYLMTRRAADERRDESINLRIKEFSRTEVEKLRLEMASKFSELQILTQQSNTTITTLMQNVVKLENEIGQLKVELARVSLMNQEKQQ